MGVVVATKTGEPGRNPAGEAGLGTAVRAQKAKKQYWGSTLEKDKNKGIL